MIIAETASGKVLTLKDFSKVGPKALGEKNLGVFSPKEAIDAYARATKWFENFSDLLPNPPPSEASKIKTAILPHRHKILGRVFNEETRSWDQVKSIHIAVKYNDEQKKWEIDFDLLAPIF